MNKNKNKNYKYLEKYRSKRSETCKKRAKKTIKSMLKDKASITFSSVAKKSGLSRSYLYKNTDIREIIMSYRQAQSEKTTVRVTTVDTSKDNLITCLYNEIEALKFKLDKKENDIKKLKKENNFLMKLKYE